MQKILELTTKDFMTGLAISSHYPASGIFIDGGGINPYRNALTGGADVGLLQTSEDGTDISSTVVVDKIIGGTYLGSSFKGYFIGDSGHFYDLNTSALTSAPTDLRSGTPITNPADGMAIYQINGGTKYLYYAQRTQIGRWDLSGSHPTGWLDNYVGSGGSGFAVALQSTDIRPMHQFLGNLYYGNKDRIGALYDDGTATIRHDDNLLDIPSDYTIVSIDDDGQYLIFAATTNTISGNLNILTSNKIFFWDTVSNSWNKEWTIPCAYIASIQTLGSFQVAITSNGIYAFSFSTPPTLLLPLSSNDTPARVGGVSPTDGLATVKDEVLYWLNSNEQICAWGKPIPGLSNRFYKPFVTLGGTGSYISSPSKFFILAASNSKLNSINTSSGGTSNTRTAETIYMPLGRRWNIEKIEVFLGEPMASTDSLDIEVKSDEDTAAVEYGTFDYTNDGAVRAKPLMGKNFHVENLKLRINFDGGNPKVKKIIVWGTPLTV